MAVDVLSGKPSATATVCRLEEFDRATGAWRLVADKVRLEHPGRYINGINNSVRMHHTPAVWRAVEESGKIWGERPVCPACLDTLCEENDRHAQCIL